MVLCCSLANVECGLCQMTLSFGQTPSVLANTLRCRTCFFHEWEDVVGLVFLQGLCDGSTCYKKLSLFSPVFFSLEILKQIKWIVFYRSWTIDSHFCFLHLDYCRSLYTCFSQTALNCLRVNSQCSFQAINQNELVPHYPLLASLNWLPVKLRIKYKILLIT